MATTNIKDLKPKPPVDPATLKPKELLAHMLERKRKDIAAMLPSGPLTVDRLFKLAIVAATTTPALAKCEIASVVAAVGFCAQLGLEPNTPLGHAYLVPFNTKRKDGNGNEYWVNSVQVIIGYRGYIELARRSGQIVSITAHEVREKDKFTYAYGLREKLDHIPARGDRGEIIGFYAVAMFKGGGHAFEFMDVAQINEIRDGSQGWQQAQKYKKTATHPWQKHFVEMGRKSAIRRIAKFLPLTVQLTQAFAADGRTINDAPQLNDPNTIDGDFSWVPDGDGDDELAAAAAADQNSAGEPGDGEQSADEQPGDEPAGNAPPALPDADPFDASQQPANASKKAAADPAYERRKG
ncbi:recombinase RecT [Paraburkholderia phymatum]|uniref:RecT protein n=1 Tax=Paraburkholderia phymatum (strain DSM 17167 / CIP 108236 / LMG 21445 / STM815) TaxID=391038 RepID=B2JU71_PARP8|nr:recombinase RecT [Paraburkholderia phymatum]ACC76124.1 RecT protein [Paraburkholderia phymatum STM815]